MPAALTPSPRLGSSAPLTAAVLQGEAQNQQPELWRSETSGLRSKEEKIKKETSEKLVFTSNKDAENVAFCLYTVPTSVLVK